jgi:hypothetical protein
LTLLDKREGTGICRGSYLYNLHSLSLSWRLVPDNNIISIGCHSHGDLCLTTTQILTVSHN